MIQHCESLESRRLFSASGVVFEDMNGDGVRDPGDAALVGWRVYVDLDRDGTFDAGETNALSDADGAWQIPVLPPGKLIVRLERQAGWLASPTKPTTGAYFVSGEQDATGLDFGTAQFASISGRAFIDTDGDGTLDAGESILGSNTFSFVLRVNDQNKLQGTLQTDAEGRFASNFLRPGILRIFTNVPGRLPATGASSLDYPLTSGQARDIALAVPPAGSFGGTVFQDNNANGRFDAGDVPLEATVWLDEEGTGRYTQHAPQVRSGANGQYRFENLHPGRTYLFRVLPEGKALITPRIGHRIDVQPGENPGNYAFALGPVGHTIKGFAFDDINQDGLWSGSLERGQFDVTAWLDLNRDGIISAGEPSTTSVHHTDEVGAFFVFDGVAPGSYSVGIVPLATTRLTTPRFVEVQTGTPAAANVTFGLAANMYINGRLLLDSFPDPIPLAGRRVWVDFTGDGKISPGEPAATTDATGRFVLTGLPVANWRVVADLPAAYRRVWQVNTSLQYPVAQPVLKVFGRGSASGTVYFDTNENGVRDAGEPPAVNWLVQAGVDSPIDPSYSTRTDAQGRYLLDGLLARTYPVYASPNGIDLIELEGQPIPGRTQPISGVYALRIVTGLHRPNFDFGIRP